VLEAGRVGEWSKPHRFVVRAGAIRSKSPKSHERIELATGEEPVFFEWTPVDGAQSYELELGDSATGRSIKKNTSSTALAVPDLGPGLWDARVEAFAGKQNVASSEPLRVELLKGEKSRIETLQPQEGDVLAAFEKSRIRWKRAQNDLDRSTVEIKRVGAEQGQILKVEGAPEAWLPALEPGLYQITIREGRWERSFGVRVENDPLLERRSRLGVNWRVISLAPVFGSAHASNGVLRDLGVEIASHGAES
jgi:hypothetical protein